MRIVMANAHGRVTGGADRHCFELAEALRDRGHEVRFLATADDANVVDGGEFVRLRVSHATRDQLPVWRRPGVAAGAIWNREAYRAMRTLIDEFRPDLLHAHKLYTQLSVSPVVAATRRQVPVVQTLHDYEMVSASAIDDQGGLRDGDESRLSYRTLNTATYPIRRFIHAPRVASWIAVSKFVAEASRRRGIEAAVLPNFVLPYGGDRLRFEDRRGAIYLGRLTVEKGIEDVIELARRVPSLPVQVSGAGPLAHAVSGAAAELPNLEFLGSIEHHTARDLLGSARIAVVPSRWQEPGSLVALEAMSVGTPVVAYASGGLAEYVRDSGAGRLIEKRPELLTAACAELQSDRGAWERMSAAGLTAARGQHSIERYLDRIEKIYDLARR